MRNRVAAQVLIHIDERRRDAAMLLALGRLLTAAGIRVTFSTRRTTSTLLRGGRFDAALLPVISPYLPSVELPRRRRCKLYLLPTEGAIFGELPLMAKFGGGNQPERWDHYVQSTTRFFLWGDHSRRALQATGRFREDQLVVIGAPRMDVHLVEPSPEERRLQDPRAIGAITGVTLLNSYYRLTAFDVIDNERRAHGRGFAPTRNIEDSYWVEGAHVRLWLELLDECQRRGERLTLRVHPREDLQAYDYVRNRYHGIVRLDGQDVPFEAWLERVGVVIGFSSTAFFEAVAANKPAISLTSLIGPRLHDHLDGFVGSHYPIIDQLENPPSWEALFEAIERIRQGLWDGYRDETKAVLKDVCHYPRATSALAAIVQTLLQDLEGTSQRRGGVDRMIEGLADIRAQALDYGTFAIRRERVVSAWFPLELRRLERQLDLQIRRYLRAASQAQPSASGGTMAIGEMEMSRR